MSVLLAGSACRKEVEKLVVQEVDKQYSWAEVKHLINYQRNVIQVTKGVNTLNLQQIGRFEVLSPIPGSPEKAADGYYTGFGLNSKSRTWGLDPLPYDVRNAVPMNANFYANPRGSNDTVLTIYPTKFLDRGTQLRLRKLDPDATEFENFLIGSRFPSGVINRNDYLLCGYRTTNFNEPAFRLVLSKLVNTASTGLTINGGSSGSTTTGTTQVSSQIIRIPTPGPSQFQFKSFWAIDDYFLVWCDGYGLFKITENGSFQQVNGTFTQATGPVNPGTIYKWKGVVYAMQRGGTIWTSANDCASWQRFDGFNPELSRSSFYPVNDSLVCITQSAISNSIYTLRWLNANTMRLRELKNDGIGYANFSNLVQLGDTVYLGTTNGLFKRPLKNFFESKP